MDRNNVREEVRNFLENSFFFEFDDQICSNTNLLEAGVMDSFGFVQMIQFLELSHGIKFADDDYASPKLTNLDGIVEVVKSRQSS